MINLDEDLKRTAKEATAFVAQSNEFEDDEITTRLGVSREVINTFHSSIDSIDSVLLGSDYFYALHGSLNEICNGISISEKTWSLWFSISRAEVCRQWGILKEYRAHFEKGHTLDDSDRVK